MKQLGIDPWALLAQIVNFLILFVLLTKFLYEPLLKMLRRRRKKIQEGLRRKEEMEKKLAKLSELKAEKIAQAEKEGEKIIAQAKKEAAEIIAGAEKKARQTIQKAKKQAQEEFTQEKEGLLKRFKAQITELVLVISRQVLGETLTDQEKEQLTKSALEELKEMKGVVK